MNGEKLDINYNCPIDSSINKILEYILPVFYKIGLTPNIITMFSFVFHLLSLYQLYIYNIKNGIIFWSIAYFLDVADGSMARKYNMITEYGDFLDHGNDSIFILGLTYLIFIRYRFYELNIGIIFVVLILSYLSFMHVNYQEKILEEKNQESKSFSLVFNTNSISLDQAKKNIKYTRFFGLGVLNIIYMILFYLAYKNLKN